MEQKDSSISENQIESLFYDFIKELSIQNNNIRQQIHLYTDNSEKPETKTTKDMLECLRKINSLSYQLYRYSNKCISHIEETIASHCTHEWIIDHTAYDSHTCYYCIKCKSYK